MVKAITTCQGQCTVIVQGLSITNDYITNLAPKCLLTEHIVLINILRKYIILELTTTIHYENAVEVSELKGSRLAG